MSNAIAMCNTNFVNCISKMTPCWRRARLYDFCSLYPALDDSIFCSLTDATSTCTFSITVIGSPRAGPRNSTSFTDLIFVSTFSKSHSSKESKGKRCMTTNNVLDYSIQSGGACILPNAHVCVIESVEPCMDIEHAARN